MGFIQDFLNKVASDEELNPDSELLLREAELHSLVTLHKLTVRIQEYIEADFSYRLSEETNLSGDESDISYARKHEE